MFAKTDLQKVTKRDSQKRYSTNSRNSHSKMFCKKGVLKSFTNFTGKHLCWSLFFKKAADLRGATLLKRSSSTDLSLWILRNFLKTYFAEHLQTNIVFNFLLKLNGTRKQRNIKFNEKKRVLVRKERLVHKADHVNLMSLLETNCSLWHMQV